jgi:predicted unusual protein kinase regulating ubiquinone biosynthesis (AarF/ABC1/UbiB family)
MSHAYASLTQQIYGGRAGSPENKLIAGKLISTLTEAFGRMIFCGGVVHGDPHPGNILIAGGTP